MLIFPDFSNLNIKSEPTYHMPSMLFLEQTEYSTDYNDCVETHSKDFSTKKWYTTDHFNNMFYNRWDKKPSQKSKTNSPKLLRYLCSPTQQGNQKPDTIKRHQYKYSKNKVDRCGTPRQCDICYSIYYWTHDCPDRVNLKNCLVNKVTPHQINYGNSNELEHAILEAWSSVLLDCGAS